MIEKHFKKVIKSERKEGRRTREPNPLCFEFTVSDLELNGPYEPLTSITLKTASKPRTL